MAARLGQVRIIGGKWKGRKLRFPAKEDLRPTPGRLRETLFNWLGEDVRGARCLDLCAGSGALGVEGLSRGAACVDFVEVDRRVAAALQSTLMRWGATDSRVWLQDVRRFVALAERRQQRWDIIFADPPFASNLAAWLLPRVLDLLASDASLLCFETSADRTLDQGTWRELRVSVAGDTSMRLIARAHHVMRT